MTNKQQDFIIKISAAVRKYAPSDIKAHAAIVAQAILESNWGESILSSEFHNYFGLKCGSTWKGDSVNMRTKEEFKAGVVTDVSANFRAYDSFDAGIKGYFDFIQARRYSNLKGIEDTESYLNLIKADGFATSSTYVKNCMDLVNIYNLESYAKGFGNPVDIDTIARNCIKGKYGNGEERRKALSDMGYNYDQVQKRVNELLKAGGKS